jgi:hypothetical protein
VNWGRKPVKVLPVINQFKFVGRGSTAPPGKRSKTVEWKTKTKANNEKPRAQSTRTKKRKVKQ